MGNVIDLNQISGIFGDIISILNRASFRFGDFTFNVWVGWVALFALAVLAKILWGRSGNDK